MKNNGKVRDVRILACKIKVLNGCCHGNLKMDYCVSPTHLDLLCLEFVDVVCTGDGDPLL